MKKYMLLFALMLIGIGVSSCLNDASNDASDEALSLVAPNGEKIAESIDEVRWVANDIIKVSYGEEKPFTITGIEYYPAEDGYITLVNYVMSGGVSSNFVMSNSVGLITSTKMDKLYAVNFSAEDIRQTKFGDYDAVVFGSDRAQTRLDPVIIGNTIYFCESASNCGPCMVEVIPNGNYTQVTCRGCDDCKLSSMIFNK